MATDSSSSSNRGTTKNVKVSLDKISTSMVKVQNDREFLLKNTRQIVIHCSKGIIAIHNQDIKTAKSHLNNANKLLIQYKKKTDPNLKKYLIVPEQEFVEAAAFMAIVEKRAIPSVGTLKVSEEAYVLGLLDCIGELKRFVLDKIRRGHTDDAVNAFNIMQELFSLLYPFASLDKIIKDARRKLDVDRMLVEDTRTIVTQEIRRKDLIDTIKKLKR